MNNDLHQMINAISRSANNSAVRVQEISRSTNENNAKVKEESMKKREREIENNQNLKSIVDYNKEITDYNRELVSLNKSILTKINTVNATLDNIINSVNENTKISKEDSIQHNALLLELITIMEGKEKGKFVEFLEGLSGNVATGLIAGYLKHIMGVS